MNKTVSIILIVLLSILTIIITGAFILLLRGNFKFNMFSIGFNSYSENLVDSKEYTNIEDIYVNVDVADVFFEEGSADTIKVELYSEDADDYYIKEEDNKISIRLMAKKNKMHFFGKANRVIVKVPSTYEQNVKVDLSTGDVKVDSFANMKLEVNGSTGDITATKLDTLDFKLSTGDVKVDNLNYISGKLTTGDIKIGSVGEFSCGGSTGDIKIDNLSKRIYAKLTTGDIKIERATIEEDSTINTSTGDVKIERLEGAYIEAHASTGDIKVNNNDRMSEKIITINTTTGDIKVN